MPQRFFLLMHHLKLFFHEVLNGVVFLAYVLLDISFLDKAAVIVKIFGALVFSIYFLNQIRWRVIKPHYEGSWKRWTLDWFGLKGSKNGNP